MRIKGDFDEREIHSVHSIDESDHSGIKSVSDPGLKTTVDLTGADGETMNILATVKDKKSAVITKLD